MSRASRMARTQSLFPSSRAVAPVVAWRWRTSARASTSKRQAVGAPPRAACIRGVQRHGPEQGMFASARAANSKATFNVPPVRRAALHAAAASGFHLQQPGSSPCISEPSVLSGTPSARQQRRPATEPSEIASKSPSALPPHGLGSCQGNLPDNCSGRFTTADKRWQWSARAQMATGPVSAHVETNQKILSRTASMLLLPTLLPPLLLLLKILSEARCQTA
mmetsp:Transcript_14639/g.28831  ORF Transcript_14639/g.28831 Transcript_14639/m.28831 type:complete len:221 (+) Transcript_14639:240-902(+)